MERSLELRKLVGEFADRSEGFFITRDVWDQHNVRSAEGKQTVWDRLHELVDKGVLEKKGQRYRKRQKGRRMDAKANPEDLVVINWPRSIEDDSHFQLDSIRLYKKAIAVVAGVSNKGKTTLCLNLVIENLDHPSLRVKYISNELADEELVDRLRNMHWINAWDKNGDYRFEAVELFENWQDEIDPDCINIIDYLDPGTDWANVGTIIDAIRQRLRNGIAIIALQKRGSKYRGKDGKDHYIQADYGVGGQFSEHRARLVIHIDPTDEDNRFLLTIKKAKGSLTGRKFSFSIVNKGAQLHQITEVYE